MAVLGDDVLVHFVEEALLTVRGRSAAALAAVREAGSCDWVYW